MSIILKGIDMPSKIDLDLHDNHIVLGGVLYPIDIDQLVYIPTPHGRLIDMDKWVYGERGIKIPVLLEAEE